MAGKGTAAGGVVNDGRTAGNATRRGDWPVRVLKFPEMMDSSGKVVWLQCREMACSMPMVYVAEHMPFLRYRGDGVPLEIEVRAEYYGKTWRCFSACPIFEDDYLWDEVDGDRGPWDRNPGSGEDETDE